MPDIMAERLYIPGDSPMTLISMRLPESMYDAVAQVAEVQDVAKSVVIRHAIKLYLEAYDEAAK